MEFENFEKYNMIECFTESNKNSREAADLYFQKYPERRQPNPKIFGRLRENLINYGSFKQPRPKKYNTETEEMYTMEIIGNVVANPKTSSRQLQRDLNIPSTSVLRILKNNKFKPYKIRKVHSLHPGDAERRMEFCHWYLNQLERGNNFFRRIIWTDEARISSEGIFNRNNHLIWSDFNPHETVNRAQQGRFGFNVWCAILSNRVLAYHIYEGNLNAERYVQMLQDNLLEGLDDVALNQRIALYFQQDGAPAHNARISTQFLNESFNGRWIGTRGPILWPPRSPDLTPMDYFLWGHLKNKIYENRNVTVNELRQNFENAIGEISNVHIINSLRSLRRRCELCIQHNGNQFEHFL